MRPFTGDPAVLFDVPAKVDACELMYQLPKAATRSFENEMIIDVQIIDFDVSFAA
jgi:hypothetical protein